MHEFFKGWQRKAGCFTLVMACALTAVWIRSLLVKDNAYCKMGKVSSIGLISNGQYIGVVILRDSRPIPTYGWDASPVLPFEQNVLSDPNLWWPWSIPGFGFTASSDRSWQNWSCPYWSIVIPLTLVSAWLLLSRPRPAAKSDPVPADGEKHV